MAESDSGIVADGLAEAGRIFALQHAASRAGGIADATLRRDRLARLAALVTANADAIERRRLVCRRLPQTCRFYSR